MSISSLFRHKALNVSSSKQTRDTKTLCQEKRYQIKYEKVKNEAKDVKIFFNPTKQSTILKKKRGRTTMEDGG